MDAYTNFAAVYDTLMDDTPYEEWADYITSLLQAEGITDGLVLDLGCGTGTVTGLLAGKGYQMIGVDFSQEMLSIAAEKKESSGQDILYIQQDMRELELYGTVGAVVSLYDAVNYLLEERDMIETFCRVNNYLDPDGLFIFDFNTVYKYQEVISDAVIAENREDCSFIMENDYDPESHINEYDLTIFVEEKPDIYRKFHETHWQRGYLLEEIKQMLQTAGMEFVAAYDGETHGETHERSERIYVIARERGK